MRGWLCIFLVLAACEDTSRSRRRDGEDDDDNTAALKEYAARARAKKQAQAAAAVAAVARCVGGPDCYPDAVIIDLDGIAHRPVDLAGKIVILHFWATWSGASTMMIPALSEIATRYAGDVVVLGLSIDQDSSAAGDKAASLGMTYPTAMTAGLESVFDIPTSIPTTWIYDRSGHRVEQQIGGSSVDELDADIRPLL